MVACPSTWAVRYLTSIGSHCKESLAIFLFVKVSVACYVLLMTYQHGCVSHVGTGLQGQAVFRSKLTFRPHSTDSQTHRKMTLSIADRFSKAQKIRVLPAVGKDPESQRLERIKVLTLHSLCMHHHFARYMFL